MTDTPRDGAGGTSTDAAAEATKGWGPKAKVPTFRFERAILKREPAAIIAGIDEVGCAPLAGPVVAAAVILDQKKLPKTLRQGLDDSKKLSREKREEFYDLLMSCGAAVIGVGQAEVHEIDSLNIYYAAQLAWRRAIDRLNGLPTVAIIDGNRKPKEFPCAVETIVKGDGKSLSIAAASVIAKVTRDRFMAELAVAFPGYGWEKNVGYPTKVHRAAILALGLTPHHRRSFGLVREQLAGPQPEQVDLPFEATSAAE